MMMVKKMNVEEGRLREELVPNSIERRLLCTPPLQTLQHVDIWWWWRWWYYGGIFILQNTKIFTIFVTTWTGPAGPQLDPPSQWATREARQGDWSVLGFMFHSSRLHIEQSTVHCMYRQAPQCTEHSWAQQGKVHSSAECQAPRLSIAKLLSAVQSTAHSHNLLLVSEPPGLPWPECTVLVQSCALHSSILSSQSFVGTTNKASLV